MSNVNTVNYKPSNNDASNVSNLLGLTIIMSIVAYRTSLLTTNYLVNTDVDAEFHIIHMNLLY